MTDKKRGNPRLTLVMLAMVFLLPMIAAYLYRPSGETGNYGTLIQPPRALEHFEMVSLDGREAGLDELKGKWTLLYPGSGVCREKCRRSLYIIERVRLTQGKNMKRVQSLYLAPETMSQSAVAGALVEYEGVQGYRLSRAELAAMAPGFDWQGDSESAAHERIYIVDPLGNLMMFYSGNAEPSGIKDDLERLLKVSQIG
jgi:cytochrome oxidase Cu insertion factor (SCO1/SenC/PrrC family)